MKIAPFCLGLILIALTMTTGQSNEPAPVPSADDVTTTVVGNLAGICAVVRKEPESANVLIVEVLPEGAADKAGLRARDRIVQVDGKSIEGVDLKEVVSQLRGQPGSQVKLSILRDEVSEPMEFTVTRELVRLKEVPSN